MKFLPIFLCLLANLPSSAQPAGLADEIFKNKENNLFLFKWNASALRPVEAFSFANDNIYSDQQRFYSYFDESHLPISFSLEGLVANRWSVQANFAGTFFHKNEPVRAFSRFGIEGRWHLAFFNEAKSKRRGSNLNGIYTALDFSVYEQIPGKNIFDWFYQHKQTATARLGFQSRFLGGGFFDASLGFGREIWLNAYSYNQEPKSGEKAVFVPRLNFGWAIGSSNPPKISEAARDLVFQKNRPTVQMFKFDLLNLFKFRGEGLMQINPALAWQTRIFRGISVELQTAMPISHQKKPYGTGSFITENSIGFVGGIEPRCIFAGYRKGSLNGIFFGWNYSQGFFIKNGDHASHQRERVHRKTFILGMQSRIFEKGFIEYKIGFGNTKQKNWWLYKEFPTQNVSKNHLFSELKTGLVF